MMPGRSRPRSARCRIARGTLALALPVTLLFSGNGLAASGDNSAATITGSFADSCRDFAAHSSKDISHVAIRYADGRVVKDERTTTPDYAIDGGPGDEIDIVLVKSGTTTETFTCPRTNSPPTALLEINTPPIDQTLGHCDKFWAGGLACEAASPRTDWTDTSEIPNDGGSDSGFFLWVCGAVLACPPTITATFRGTSSSDPDNDIVGWSLDFGDGTVASGSWSSDPPAGVFHDYADTTSCSGPSGICVVVLTVTDAAGQSDSDTMLLGRVDQTPD